MSSSDPTATRDGVETGKVPKLAVTGKSNLLSQQVDEKKLFVATSVKLSDPQPPLSRSRFAISG